MKTQQQEKKKKPRFSFGILMKEFHYDSQRKTNRDDLLFEQMWLKLFLEDEIILNLIYITYRNKNVLTTMSITLFRY